MKLEINLDQLAIIVESWLESAGLHLASAQAGLNGARIMGYKYAVAVYYLSFAVIGGFEAIPGVLNGIEIKESDRWRNWRKKAEDLIAAYEKAFDFKLYVSETTGKGYAPMPSPSNTAPKGRPRNNRTRRGILSLDTARDIRTLRKPGPGQATRAEVCKTYNISPATLSRIMLNQAYYDPDYTPPSKGRKGAE